MLLLVLPSLALAAEIDRFPAQAPLDLAACTACTAAQKAGQGAIRLPLPTGLRSAADPTDGSDLLVVGPDGEAVPFAVVRGSPALDTFALYAEPTANRGVWHIGVQERPYDGLDVDLADAAAAATVRVYDEGTNALIGGPTLVFHAPSIDRTAVTFPPTRGPLRVELQHHFPYDPGAPDIDGTRRSEASVDPVDIELPVTEARMMENGWARYTVQLPQPLPVRAVTLTVKDSLFDRGVMVTTDPPEADLVYPSETDHIRRILLGGAAVDDVTVAAPEGLRTDTLQLWVEAQGKEALTIPAVTVHLDGQDLLLHDPGPGPFTIYGGAPAGTTLPSDLAAAIPELSRMASHPVDLGPVGPNPAFRPPELRANLVDPGTLLDIPFAWRRPIEGGPGLRRTTLPAEVLAALRPDRGDLRLVDAEGHQIPYLLRRRADDLLGDSIAFRREEQGTRSLLRIPIADPAIPLSTITIQTGAPLFSRQVTLSRADGPDLVPLRTFQWDGQDRPTTLTLDLDQVVGPTLVLTVENGDNPPLPIDRVALARPHWELIAQVPEGGATLRYGNARIAAPQYDLALLRDELLTRPMTEGTLGPAAAEGPPARSLFEKAALFGGIAVLALGLIALTLSLLRGVPSEEPAPPPAA